MSGSRIKTLDGFRAIAIISVLFFHYFSRWIPPRNEVSLYPYNNAYDYFSHGNLGVQFFFIISGFVIAFTLENTEKFTLFWKKRFVRLFPSMLVASLITFVILSLFDKGNIFPQGHLFKNFVSSLTFVSPSILNNSLPGFHVDYLSRSYWSLWPEIQFYFLASLIYFFRKETFIKNFILVSFFLIALNYLIGNIQGSNVLHLHLPASFLNAYSNWVLGGFNLVTYLPFFCMGSLFYILFKNKQSNTETSRFVKVSIAILILFALYSGIGLPVRVAYLLMIAIFFAFIFIPRKLSIFETKPLQKIGGSSYFLYLIHENLGVLVINLFAGYFMPAGFVFTLLVMLFFIWGSNVYTKTLDKTITDWLRRKLIPKTTRAVKKTERVQPSLVEH